MNPLLDPPITAYPDLLQPTWHSEVAELIMNNLPTLKSLVLILPEKNFRFTRDQERGGAVWLMQNEVEVDNDAWMKVQLTDDFKNDGDD